MLGMKVRRPLHDDRAASECYEVYTVHFVRRVNMSIVKKATTRTQVCICKFPNILSEIERRFFPVQALLLRFPLLPQLVPGVRWECAVLAVIAVAVER